MEPLSTAAVAIASIIVTKTFEKTGEKLGEAFTDQVGQLVNLLRGKQKHDLATIGQSENKINYRDAVAQLEAASEVDPEINRAVEVLEATIITEPQLLHKLQATVKAIQDEPKIVYDYRKLADKIGVVVQPGASATIGDIHL
jgi:hypothetical protein